MRRWLVVANNAVVAEVVAPHLVAAAAAAIGVVTAVPAVMTVMEVVVTMAEMTMAVVMAAAEVARATAVEATAATATCIGIARRRKCGNTKSESRSSGDGQFTKHERISCFQVDARALALSQRYALPNGRDVMAVTFSAFRLVIPVKRACVASREGRDRYPQCSR
jgi:hypothetical protein